MAKLKIKIKGERDILKKVNELSKKFPQATSASVYQEGFGVLAVSQRKVPVDTGRLRSTGYVSPPRQINFPIVEVGYGTKYAIIQHERTDFIHRGIGEAKFLEKAFNEKSKGYARRLAQRIWQNQQKGIGVRSIPAKFPERPNE